MAGPFRIMSHIEAFDGGLNTKYEPSIIGNAESPDCQNVTFDDLGAVQTRQGITKLNSTSRGTFACDGLFTTKYNDGGSTMVAWFGGTAYSWESTTFATIGSAQSVYTSGTRVEHAMYQNIVFASNGLQPYKYTSGSDFTRHGVDVPNSIPGAASGAVGTLTGDYQYKVAYVNSLLVVGNPSSFTATLAVVSGKVDLTSIPVAPQSFGVASRNVYRNEAGGTTYKLMTTIADNTTATFTDNVDDSALGAAAKSDNGLPPNWHIIKAFQERLFVVDQSTNPQYLYYSELGEPFTFGSANFIKIADGDGENITGLSIQGNALVVYKDQSVWLIYMPDTTPSNWVRIKTNAKYGGASHRAIVDYEDRQMYIGKQGEKVTGFYALSGTQLEPDVTALTITNMFGDSKGDRIEPDVLDFQESQAANFAAIQFDNKLYFAATKGSGNSANNRIYQFDFKRRDKSRAVGSWVPFTGLNPAIFTVFNGKLYFGSSLADGFIQQLENGLFSDNGVAIDSYYWTKEFEGPQADTDYEKDYRYANFIMETLGAWVIGVTQKVDSDVGGGNVTEVDMNPGSNLWGTAIFGTDEWGGGVTRGNFKVELGNSVGKKIQFKFDNRNTVSRGFKVLRGDYYYNKRGLR